MEKRKLSIPTSYADITLGDLQKIRSFEGDDEFIAIKIIETLAGISAKEALRMRAKDRDEIIELISDALIVQPSKLQKTCTLNGVKYGFIPNLNDITWGEFVDIETYQGDFANIHKLMAILYRPIVKEWRDNYEIEFYTGSAKYAHIMKDSPSDIALGAMVFFCALGMELLNNSLKSLVERANQMKNKPTLVKNGDGIAQLRALQAMISEDLRKSLSLTLNNALPNLHTKLINTN